MKPNCFVIELRLLEMSDGFPVTEKSVKQVICGDELARTKANSNKFDCLSEILYPIINNLFTEKKR